MKEKPGELFSTAAQVFLCNEAWAKLPDKEKWEKYGVAPMEKNNFNFGPPVPTGATDFSVKPKSMKKKIKKKTNTAANAD